MATEIARAPCVAGRIPDDQNSESGQALKECLEELTQQDGFQRLYWGFEVENPDVFRLFIDWDSIEAHEKFMATPGYKPFTERLGFFLDLSKLELYHVHFTPHPPTEALSDTSSPMTEILNVYFPASYSSSDQEAFVEGLKNLVGAIESNAGTYHGSAGGWAKEEVPIPDSTDKGKLFVAVIGWDSVQAHEAFRETQPFKDNIHHLRKAKDLKGLKVVHSSCLLVTRGGGVGDDAGESVQEEVLNPQRGGKQSVKTKADGTTTKNDGGAANSNKKERQGRGDNAFS